jgi:hypothetical protein
MEVKEEEMGKRQWDCSSGHNLNIIEKFTIRY